MDELRFKVKSHGQAKGGSCNQQLSARCRLSFSSDGTGCLEHVFIVCAFWKFLMQINDTILCYVESFFFKKVLQQFEIAH